MVEDMSRQSGRDKLGPSSLSAVRVRWQDRWVRHAALKCLNIDVLEVDAM